MRSTKEMICLICFLVVFPCGAMQQSDLHRLPPFLEFLLEDHETNEKRKDPPFYRLTTFDNREIYILGSIHNLHPKLLLPIPCFQKLNNIHDQGAILFTESSGYEHHTNSPSSLLSNLTEASQNLWDVGDYLYPNDQEDWNFIEHDLQHEQMIVDYSTLPGPVCT